LTNDVRSQRNIENLQAAATQDDAIFGNGGAVDNWARRNYVDSGSGSSKGFYDFVQKSGDQFFSTGL